MNRKYMFKCLNSVLVAALALMLGACSEDDDNPTSASEHQPVTIVVMNDDGDRVAGASIRIDNNDNLTCETSGPGGNSGGECRFLLKKIEHSITITKATYHTLNDTFIVTGNTTYLYFPISNN